MEYVFEKFKASPKTLLHITCIFVLLLYYLILGNIFIYKYVLATLVATVFACKLAAALVVASAGELVYPFLAAVYARVVLWWELDPAAVEIEQVPAFAKVLVLQKELVDLH